MLLNAAKCYALIVFKLVREDQQGEGGQVTTLLTIQIRVKRTSACSNTRAIYEILYMLYMLK